MRPYRCRSDRPLYCMQVGRRLRAFGERLVHGGLPKDFDLPDETPGA